MLYLIKYLENDTINCKNVTYSKPLTNCSVTTMVKKSSLLLLLIVKIIGNSFGFRLLNDLRYLVVTAVWFDSKNVTLQINNVEIVRWL